MKTMLLFLILASAPYSVFAVELVEGEVDGKIKFHNQTKFDPTTIVVRSKKIGDESIYKIEMIHDERLYKFDKLNLDFMPQKMMFNLDTGQEYNCELFFDENVKKDITECKDKEGYCGKCVQPDDSEKTDDDEKQELIIINMKSPVKVPEPPIEEDK